jgi:hypothetical protein
MQNKVDEFIDAKVTEQYRSILNNFRKLISTEFTKIREEMRRGTEKYYGVPVYRHKKIIITISPTKKGITFSFTNGKKFEDKYSLLEGLGNKSLNYRISKIEDFKKEIMRYYINQALLFDE